MIECPIAANDATLRKGTSKGNCKKGAREVGSWPLGRKVTRLRPREIIVSAYPIEYGQEKRMTNLEGQNYQLVDLCNCVEQADISS